MFILHCFLFGNRNHCGFYFFKKFSLIYGFLLFGDFASWVLICLGLSLITCWDYCPIWGVKEKDTCFEKALANPESFSFRVFLELF